MDQSARWGGAAVAAARRRQWVRLCAAHRVGTEPRPGAGAAASENWIPEEGAGVGRGLGREPAAPDPRPLTLSLQATMGNVLAASSPPAGPPPAPALVGLPPPPPPPGFTLPPLGGGLGAGAGRGSERTPGAAAASPAGTADEGACGCLPNPGTFEECHRKCKGEGRGAQRGREGPGLRARGSAWRPPWELARTLGII